MNKEFHFNLYKDFNSFQLVRAYTILIVRTSQAQHSGGFNTQLSWFKGAEKQDFLPIEQLAGWEERERERERERELERKQKDYQSDLLIEALMIDRLSLP